MSLIGTLLGYALTVFIVLLIARILLDWAEMLTSVPPRVRRVRVLTRAGETDENATRTLAAPPEKPCRLTFAELTSTSVA